MSQNLFDTLWMVFETSMNASYRLIKKIDASIDLVRAEETLGPKTPEDLGWSGYFEQINIIKSTGNHFSIITNENSSNWVAKLNR